MIAKVERRSNWIVTYPTKSKFYPAEPRAEDVHIEDIAHSLPMQARFLGHVSRFYSVGEHSCHVADWILKVTGDEIAAACALLHDGEETYVGDMPRPLKHYGPLAAYRSICGRCTVAILERFGLTEAYRRHEGIIKVADDQLLHTEAQRLGHGDVWSGEGKALTEQDVRIDQYSEQMVIDLLESVARDEPNSHTRLLRAIELLKDGGAHRRWHDEFMERFETWLPNG